MVARRRGQCKLSGLVCPLTFRQKAHKEMCRWVSGPALECCLVKEHIIFITSLLVNTGLCSSAWATATRRFTTASLCHYTLGCLEEMYLLWQKKCFNLEVSQASAAHSCVASVYDFARFPRCKGFLLCCTWCILMVDWDRNMPTGGFNCCGTLALYLLPSREVSRIRCDLWWHCEMLPWLVFPGYILISSFGLSKIFGSSTDLVVKKLWNTILAKKNEFNQFFLLESCFINLTAGVPSLRCREELEKVASCRMWFS